MALRQLKKRTCQTCGETFLPDRKAFCSYAFCYKACEMAMQRYRKAMRLFERKLSAFEAGRSLVEPYPPVLQTPNPAERAASRREMCEAYNRRCHSAVYVLTDDTPQDAHSDDLPAFSRRCHTCGAPTNRYWCRSCMEKRAKKYGFSLEDAGYFTEEGD